MNLNWDFSRYLMPQIFFPWDEKFPKKAREKKKNESWHISSNRNWLCLTKQLTLICTKLTQEGWSRIKKDNRLLRLYLIWRARGIFRFFLKRENFGLCNKLVIADWSMSAFRKCFHSINHIKGFLLTSCILIFNIYDLLVLSKQ